MKNFIKSTCVHAVIVAVILLLGSTAHKLVPVHYQTALSIPIDLPVPMARPGHMVSGHTEPAKVAASTQFTAARLVAGASTTLHTPLVDEQPRMVALSNPAAVELPTTAVRVTEAPQAVIGAFGSAAGTASGRSAGTANQAGFGAATRSQGTGRSGAGRVVMAGFSVNPPSELPAVATRTPVIQPATVQSIPRAHYTAEARSAGTAGQVVLRVCFKADSTVQVLGVVRGLDHGLDAEAARVAAGVHFVPEMHDGAPVDSVHLLSVDFQLADQ